MMTAGGGNRGFASLLGMILALAVLAAAAYFALQAYSRKPAAAERGIDVAAPLSAVDIAKEKVGAANAASAEREQQMREYDAQTE